MNTPTRGSSTPSRSSQRQGQGQSILARLLTRERDEARSPAARLTQGARGRPSGTPLRHPSDSDPDWHEDDSDPELHLRRKRAHTRLQTKLQQRAAKAAKRKPLKAKRVAVPPKRSSLVSSVTHVVLAKGKRDVRLVVNSKRRVPRPAGKIGGLPLEEAVAERLRMEAEEEAAASELPATKRPRLAAKRQLLLARRLLRDDDDDDDEPEAEEDARPDIGPDVDTEQATGSQGDSVMEEDAQNEDDDGEYEFNLDPELVNTLGDEDETDAVRPQDKRRTLKEAVKNKADAKGDKRVSLLKSLSVRATRLDNASKAADRDGNASSDQFESVDQISNYLRRTSAEDRAANVIPSPAKARPASRTGPSGSARTVSIVPLEVLRTPTTRTLQHPDTAAVERPETPGVVTSDPAEDLLSGCEHCATRGTVNRPVMVEAGTNPHPDTVLFGEASSEEGTLAASMIFPFTHGGKSTNAGRRMKQLLCRTRLVHRADAEYRQLLVEHGREPTGEEAGECKLEDPEGSVGRRLTVLRRPPPPNGFPPPDASEQVKREQSSMRESILPPSNLTQALSVIHELRLQNLRLKTALLRKASEPLRAPGPAASDGEVAPVLTALRRPRGRGSHKELAMVHATRLSRLERLERGVERVFSPVQISVLCQGDSARAQPKKWPEGDLRRAVELRAMCSRKVFDFVRGPLGLPLPTHNTLEVGCQRYPDLHEELKRALGEPAPRCPTCRRNRDDATTEEQRRKFDAPPRPRRKRPPGQKQAPRRKKPPTAAAIALARRTGRPVGDSEWKRSSWMSADAGSSEDPEDDSGEDEDSRDLIVPVRVMDRSPGDRAQERYDVPAEQPYDVVVDGKSKHANRGMWL